MSVDLLKAMQFAMKCHEGQLRKFQNVPYVWHPISVAKLVELYKDSKHIEELRVAALLHDTVEDTDVTVEDIVKEFGYIVAQLVDELTSDKEEIKRIGKTEYLKQKLVSMSSYALVIKLCDRLDNVLDLKLTKESFRTKYVKETFEIITYLISHRMLTSTQYTLCKVILNEINSYVKNTDDARD